MRVYLDNCCYNRPFDDQAQAKVRIETEAKLLIQSGGFDMTKTITDNQLRTECFNVLVDHFGYLDTERFVVMMSRSPEDYTSWHQRHFANGETVRELGEKIKTFVAAKRQEATA